ADHEVARRKIERRAPRADARFAPVGGRALPQRASDPAWPARPEHADADADGIPLRRRAARAARSAAVGEPARCMGARAAKRLARDVAGSLDGADRNRWPARADRSGLGSARISFAPRRPEALPTRSGR